MRDLSEESWLRMRWAQDRLRDLFWLHGYRVLEPPILEPTELFLKKSGGQLATRMYAMTDPGGNLVSLRPEFTSSIVRHYLDGGLGNSLPQRVQYCGPVFRYERDQGSCRQFTQVGAELLGSSGPMSDAEGVSLAMGALSALGLKDYRVVIGDLSLYRGLLGACGLSERAIAFVLDAVSELKEGAEGLDRVRQRAGQLGLLTSGSRPDRGITAGAAIRDMPEGEVRDWLQELLRWAGPEESGLGQRDPSEIVDRLLRKVRGADDPARLESGLEIAYRLASVRGEPAGALEEARALVRSSRAAPDLLDPLAQVMELLDSGPGAAAGVSLDFGLARGLAYYTGIIFDVEDPITGTPLGGGGRYDGLARALGSPVDIPALGFAYTLESLLDVVRPEEMGEARPSTRKATYVWAGDLASYKRALAVASEVRGQGSPAEVEVCGRSLEEGISFARERGFTDVIAVDDDGKRTTY